MNYPTQTDVPSQSTSYNGWTNWETWNVALWIGNEEPIYRAVRRYDTYAEALPILQSFGMTTPDGVDWDDPELDVEELDEMMAEL